MKKMKSMNMKKLVIAPFSPSPAGQGFNPTARSAQLPYLQALHALHVQKAYRDKGRKG
jgi:hypothetical protein